MSGIHFCSKPQQHLLHIAFVVVCVDADQLVWLKLPLLIDR